MASFKSLFSFLILLCLCSSSLAWRSCKCLYGQPCFPSAIEWSWFNRSVGGKLIEPRPTGYYCHDPHYNEAACNEAKSKSWDTLWRSSQPGSLEVPQLEAYGSEGCYLNSTRHTPCYQGSVPVLSVNATSAADVVKTVDFARLFNLRLVVKNTGHDYNGRSTGRGALSLWTHNLQSIEFIQYRHCHSWQPPVNATRIGAGVQFRHLFKEVNDRGFTMVGPLTASVGAGGGWWQGGGHGNLAPTYGLGADNVLEFEVVTADGKLLVANECQNYDLFWAMRGGGGGTFGVVTSVTYQLHPAPKNVLGITYIFAANGTSSFRDLLAKFAAVHPSLTDAGWAGTFNILPNELIITYIALDKNSTFVKSTMGNLLNYVDQHPGLTQVFSEATSYLTYYDWYMSLLCGFYGNAMDDGECVDRLGVNRAIGSRLIPRTLLECNADAVADMLIKVLNTPRINHRILGLSVAGGKVSKPSSANAVNPAWRNAIWHITIGLDSQDGPCKLEQIENSIAVTAAVNTIKMLTPLSGAYVNEVDYNEPNWQQSMFGDHYPALKAIKHIRDPTGLFICRHCVGSEEWTPDMTCPAL